MFLEQLSRLCGLQNKLRWYPNLKLFYLCAPWQKQEQSHFIHLGCKLNFSETSTLSRMLENEGFEKKSLMIRLMCMLSILVL